MTGFIKHLLQQLNSTCLRLFFFNQETRVYFYTLLYEYTRSRFPLLQIFNDLQRQNPGMALAEIARLSKQSLRHNELFATHYQQSGLFTPTEAALLLTGQKHNCLETVTRMLLKPDEQTSATLSILTPSLQWIGMIIVITLMSLYTLPYLREFTSEGFELFFAYNDWINANWSGLLISLVLLVCLHAHLKNNLKGRARALLSRLGLFNIHGMQTEQRFMIIAASLVGAKLPPGELLQIIETTFARQRYFTSAVAQVRARLKETTLLQAMQQLVSRDSYQHVLAAAPNQTPEEIARGLATACRLQQVRLNRRIQLYKNLWLLLCFTGAIAITVPFAFVSMGMGITT